MKGKNFLRSTRMVFVKKKKALFTQFNFTRHIQSTRESRISRYDI